MENFIFCAVGQTHVRRTEDYNFYFFAQMYVPVFCLVNWNVKGNTGFSQECGF